MRLAYRFRWITLLITGLIAFGVRAVPVFGAVAIWQEDFTGEVNKGAVGPLPPTIDLVGITAWTVDVGATSLDQGTDWFKVDSGEHFSAVDLDGEAVWLSELIDISAFIDVTISADAAELGGSESSDYVRFYYRLDGGSETLFPVNGDNFGSFGSVTGQVAGLMGSTLQIVIRVKNSANAETHQFDNIYVTGELGGSNSPPVLSVAPAGTNKSVFVGDTLNFSIVALEADGDLVSLSSSNLPVGAVYTDTAGVSPVTNEFTWTPTATGLYAVSFFAADLDGTNSVTVNISASNDPIDGMTLLYYQGFEGTTNDTWAFATNPSTYNISGDVWSAVGSVGSIPGPSQASTFWGMRDLDNPNGGGSFFHTLRFPPVALSDYGNALLRFDYYTHNFNAAADIIRYSVMFDDGTNWDGHVELLKSTDAWTPVEIGVPATAAYVRLSLEAQDNGAVDYAGWDNVALWGAPNGVKLTVTPSESPLTVAVSNNVRLIAVASGLLTNTISLTASGLPTGAVFPPTEGTFSVTNIFSWTPTSMQTGSHSVLFMAVQGETSNSVEVALDVSDRLIRFVSPGDSVDENVGTQHVYVAISRAADATVQVAVAGSATEGVMQDFTMSSTTIVFAAGGSLTQELGVIVNDDLLDENDETVLLSLVHPVNASVVPSHQYLLVIQDDDVLFQEPFDADPGWATEGLWQFGPPLGTGNAGQDPATAFSGANVYGYNLGGNYENNIAVPFYLTSPPIDCSPYQGVQLTFKRWLSVESATWDHAAVEASNNGIDWVTVWDHAGSTLFESAWTAVTYDVSAVADGQEHVWIRWAMGPTDGSVTYGGWNIDDMALSGDPITNARIEFVSASYVTSETNGSMVIEAKRLGNRDIPASVDFSTGSGSATAGADYIATNGVLDFLAGQTSKTFAIQMVDDLDEEGVETVSLLLSGPSPNAEVGIRSNALLAILDDEFPRASFPFFEGFESGVLSNFWATNSTAAGRIRISSEEGPAEGTNHLCMDSGLSAVFSLNEAVLTIDLEGKTNVLFSCAAMDKYDEQHVMPAIFSGSVNADGIAVSSDGIMWHRIASLPSLTWPPAYRDVFVDLSAFAASNGLPLNEQFRIKFQQYGDYPLTSIRGRCFDNIAIYDGAQAADLLISAEDSVDPSTIGNAVTYTVTVTNVGPVSPSAVHVSGMLATNLLFSTAVSSQGACTESNGVIHCDLGSLSNGASAVITISAVPKSYGPATNRFLVESELIDPQPFNSAAQEVTQVEPPGGVLAFEADAAALREDAGGFALTVTRAEGAFGVVSADYETTSGSAIGTQDYTHVAGTVVFGNGVLSNTVFVSIIDDQESESTESFSITLHEPGGGAVVGSASNVVLSILDDDGVAQFPFSEDFEGSALSNYWSTYSDGFGEVLHTFNNIPHGGLRHITMDSGSGLALNELVLEIDLAGRTGVALDFWQKEFSDSPHPMSSAFSGHENSDGVAVSVDGTNWVRVIDLSGTETPRAYTNIEIDMDAVMASNGLAYSSRVRLKFQQYDNLAIPSDGMAFDDIRLIPQNGQFRFSAPAYGVQEGAGLLTVTVSRVNGNAGAAAVDFETLDGSALRSFDYISTTGTLFFADGDSAATITIPILTDAKSEPSETFTVRLGNPTGGATLASPSNTLVTILDDDGPGNIEFAFHEYTVVEGSNVSVAVARAGGSDGAVTVDFFTSNGTALAGSDYTATTGILVFADGQVSASFVVATLGDEVGEGLENVQLRLSHPGGGAGLGSPSSATLSIIDNDDAFYDYYASAYGLSGEALKQALHEIIDGHIVLRYDWPLIQLADENPTNSSQIWMIYLQQGRDKNAHGAGTGLWNREHVWAKSHGFGGDPDISKPPSVDYHNLRAVDHVLNSTRNNYDFREGGSHISGAPPNCRVLSSARTFEPPDAAKGDVARALFYMAVRYEGDQPDEPDLEIVDEQTSYASSSPAQMAYLARLIRWHNDDPVDSFEMRRNNVIYTNDIGEYQGNRNPFIDHPEWVKEIWGSRIATWAHGDGTISPENPMVNYGYDQAFTVAASPYYHVVGVETDGVTVSGSHTDAAYLLVWSNVIAPGRLDAYFAENLATNGVPEWWLALHGLTNDFDLAVLGDADGDGIPTGYEWLARTDPTSAVSFLRVDDLAISSDSGNRVITWNAVADRRYTLFRGPDLTAPATNALVSILTTTAGLVSVTDTLHAAEGVVYYRLTVQDP